jgi:flavin-dependent dehydrogenase
MAEIEALVLIVGGSLVGLSAALLLGHHGIPALVVEHHRGTAIHPRAAMITQRTMEVLRTGRRADQQIVLKKSRLAFVSRVVLSLFQSLDTDEPVIEAGPNITCK